MVCYWLISSGELWRNRMHRVVIHLCSPLLCQRSWLQRQLLKDGVILITIFVGIVSVQHQVLTISLSHGIVTMPELVYRMLVTLLYVSKQWGYTTSYNKVTVNFPVAYSTQIFCLTAFHSAPGVSTLDIYASHVTLNGFAFRVAAPDSAFTSFERAYWLSIGV